MNGIIAKQIVVDIDFPYFHFHIYFCYFLVIIIQIGGGIVQKFNMFGQRRVDAVNILIKQHNKKRSTFSMGKHIILICFGYYLFCLSLKLLELFT